jgi:hypothetical protein
MWQAEISADKNQEECHEKGRVPLIFIDSRKKQILTRKNI